jgi:hypothetical protein
VKVVILCGGRGTRLQEQTQSIPKPLVEIGGMPIVWHVVQLYASHGLGDVVLACGYKAGMIADFVAAAEWPAGVSVRCVDTGLERVDGEIYGSQGVAGATQGRSVRRVGRRDPASVELIEADLDGQLFVEGKRESLHVAKGTGMRPPCVLPLTAPHQPSMHELSRPARRESQEPRASGLVGVPAGGASILSRRIEGEGRHQPSRRVH